MALPITATELQALNQIVDLTRTAMTEGTEGAETIAPVVTASLFDSSPDVSNGARLNAIGMLQTLAGGVLLKSPNGTVYKLTVSNAGAVVITAV